MSIYLDLSASEEQCVKDVVDPSQVSCAVFGPAVKFSGFATNVFSMVVFHCANGPHRFRNEIEPWNSMIDWMSLHNRFGTGNSQGIFLW